MHSSNVRNVQPCLFLSTGYLISLTQVNYCPEKHAHVLPATASGTLSISNYLHTLNMSYRVLHTGEQMDNVSLKYCYASQMAQQWQRQIRHCWLFKLPDIFPFQDYNRMLGSIHYKNNVLHFIFIVNTYHTKKCHKLYRIPYNITIKVCLHIKWLNMYKIYMILCEFVMFLWAIRKTANIIQQLEFFQTIQIYKFISNTCTRKGIIIIEQHL